MPHQLGTHFRKEIYPQEVSGLAMSEAQGVLLAEFLSSCRVEGRSAQSLRGLRHRVPKLFAYLAEAALDLLSLKPKDAQAYVGWLSAQISARSQQPYRAQTVASYFTAAVMFYDYLNRRGQVASNPFKEVRRIRRDKRIPRGLLKETQMGELLEELCHFDQIPHLKAAITRYKLHLVAELMYSTGLRVSEVAALRVSDIDFARSLVTVHHAKNGYQRVAFLGEFARETLRLYVKRLRPLVESRRNARNAELVFGMGWECFGNRVNKWLGRVCAELGLPPMRSHGFRHAVGYHLLRAGCNIRHIQSILGHRNLKNTEIYTKVEKGDLKNVVDACHPRRWKAHECA